MFFFNNEKETGRVIMASDNIKGINKRFEELKKDVNKKKHQTASQEKKDESPVCPSKRPRRVNAKYSSSTFENLNSMKPPKEVHQNEKRDLKCDNKKKGDKMIQSLIEKEIVDKNRNDTIITKKTPPSPSKEELKKQLQEALRAVEELLKNSNGEAQSKTIYPSTSEITQKKKYEKNYVQDISSTTESDSDDSADKENMGYWRDSGENNGDSADDTEIKLKGDDGDEEKNKPKNYTSEKKNGKDPIVYHTDTDLNDPDLYGKNWSEEKMVKLIRQVYCKESELIAVRSMCNQASHVVRRLITGVFKPSGYLNATFTGQAPRAHKGQGNKPDPVKSLNDVAKNEIIEYALKLAAEKNWTTRKGIPQSRDELQRAMSQRIGELKRSYELTNKQQTPPYEQK